jgi:hypothetical protein
MLCFLLLSDLEPEFFLLHLYQSVIYLVIILMLFYFHDRWAYMLGMLAPAAWLVLTYGTGLLGGGLRQVARLLHAQRPSNQVSLMAAIMAVLAVVMIGSCFYRWRREFAGLGAGGQTFLVSLVVVIVYYGILVLWFWRQIPQPPASG